MKKLFSIIAGFSMLILAWQVQASPTAPMDGLYGLILDEDYSASNKTAHIPADKVALTDTSSNIEVSSVIFSTGLIRTLAITIASTETFGKTSAVINAAPSSIAKMTYSGDFIGKSAILAKTLAIPIKANNLVVAKNVIG